MNARAKAMLARIMKADWFCAVGTADGPGIVAVSSWEEAIPSSLSLAWGNLDLECANVLREKIVACSIERFNNWNSIVRELEKEIDPILKERLKPLKKEYGALMKPKAGDYPIPFYNRVRLDLTSACMEEEYADLVKPVFYAGLAKWYVAGNFPCGWQGVYPKGKLMVY